MSQRHRSPSALTPLLEQYRTDTIAASQAGFVAPDPYRRLWARVLVEAIIDATKQHESARKYIASQRVGIGSVAWICEQLGFEHPERLRRII